MNGSRPCSPDALLEDGRITDVGGHSELLERNDHYRYVISSLEENDERQHDDEEVTA